MKFILNFTILFLLFCKINIIAQDNKNIIYNYGLTKGSDITKIYLTIDLCPNKNGLFEEALFVELIELSKKKQVPININIAITALWIKQHPQELEKLLQWEKQQYFNITLINHSYHHYYNSSLDNENNFMLNKKFNPKEKIIENYNFMISKNLQPSRFFRFPGLISSDKLINIVKELNLISLGAETWLTKTNGKFKGGDIILIHGNGGEALGVKLFLKNLRNNEFNNFTFESVNHLISLGSQ
jgi:hypothetical protein